MAKRPKKAKKLSPTKKVKPVGTAKKPVVSKKIGKVTGAKKIKTPKAIKTTPKIKGGDAIKDTRIGDGVQVIDVSRDIMLRTEAAPLALFPMRLEYRFLQRRVPLIRNVLTGGAQIATQAEAAVPKAVDANAQTRSATSKRVKKQDRVQTQTGSKTASKTSSKSKAGVETRAAQDARVFEGVRNAHLEAFGAMREELWIRCYPDESFSEEGIEPVNEEERKARDIYKNIVANSQPPRQWWEIEDDALSAAWQTFVKFVGAYRAIHLMRTDGVNPGSADDIEAEQNRQGRIAVLPKRISIFTFKDGKASLLVTGKPIEQNASDKPSKISYNLSSIEPGGWLTDYNIAVASGLGLKVTDAQKLTQAKQADWIIAIGLHEGAAQDEIQDMLERHISAGKFGVLPQDSPTNNTPNSKSYLSDPDEHILEFTKQATAMERGAYASPAKTSADLLASAFGVDGAKIRAALDGSDTGFEDAKAMLWAIGPGLLGDSLSAVAKHVDVSGVFNSDLIRIMAQAVLARGALPAVRFGENAMGVLPVTKVSDFTITKGSGLLQPEVSERVPSKETKIYNFLKKYSVITKGMLSQQADHKSPVIIPGDPEATDKLREIFQSCRVSQRIDVADIQDNITPSLNNIGCGYIDGSSAHQKANAYIYQFLDPSASDLPDPARNDPNWPLLYRLMKVSWLSLHEERNSGEVNLEFERGGIPQMRRINSVALPEYRAALIHLSKLASQDDGLAKLEILMFEVLDLFQHRGDAFAVGLAYAKLNRIRENGINTTYAGYFGFLGKLKPESLTAQSDGYIQAPSSAQATTAALMRSAYLRYQADGAFKMDLSSKRVRNALKLLDLLSKGHSLSEGLGMRGERWLHDKKLDMLILPLRSAYPIKSEKDKDIGARRIFDGLHYMGEDFSNWGTFVDPTFLELQNVLKDKFDALSDIIVAEATHQRAMGNSQAANAWLQVLSGHPPPGLPVFLKTQRQAQGTSYSLMLAFEHKAPTLNSVPRAIADPALAAICVTAMPGFSNALLKLTATVTQSGQPLTQIDIALENDLELAPIDLVIGGASEIEVRAKSFLIQKFLSGAQSFDSFNSTGGLDDFVNGKLTLSVDIDSGPSPVRGLLERAETVRKAIQSGRPMEPADLNKSADSSDFVLEEKEEISIIEQGLGYLKTRVELLIQKLTGLASDYDIAFSSFHTAMEELGRRMRSQASEVSIEAQRSIVEGKLDILRPALAKLSTFSEPAALRPLSVDKYVKDIEGNDANLIELRARIAAKLTRLQQHTGTNPNPDYNHVQLTGHTQLQSARESRRLMVEALQFALDGDALPVFVPMKRQLQKMKFAIKPEPPISDFNAVLPDWSRSRKGVSACKALGALLPDARALKIDEKAILSADQITASGQQVYDVDGVLEDQHIPPSPEFTATLICDPALAASAGMICGLIGDEWSGQIPGKTQMAAMAINYDSPQSEAPHAVLLCVPPNKSVSSWSETVAAEFVGEVIDLMKARSVTSDDRITPAAMFPLSNQVDLKPAPGQAQRIPLARKWVNGGLISEAYTERAGLDKVAK